ncbi:uncharacterized protein B0I36DRAFT_356662 [Microdochium trichocladiopsis]|uniref:C2H2-type domain-containing protein n=1 Tax=Microdochium trichocladiopsis TaxID=1682393 RepID=A0A9P8XPX4_9PEZI|nr:uncharacterized protein B0I36DRAFT_356662 [Microdochium trichocladiopsis]KAH7009430.1 hypothetical protein B0I36DRAFT_356662 [Microdochium trichocladiopsis]
MPAAPRQGTEIATDSTTPPALLLAQAWTQSYISQLTVGDKEEQDRHHQAHLKQQLRHSCDWPSCARSYKTRSSLNWHKTQDHRPGSAHLCNYSCGKRFKTFELLRKHEEKDHPELVELSGAYTCSDPRPARMARQISSNTPTQQELSQVQAPPDSLTRASQAFFHGFDFRATSDDSPTSPMVTPTQEGPSSRHEMSTDDEISTLQAFPNSTIQQETKGHESFCHAINYRAYRSVTTSADRDIKTRILQSLSDPGSTPFEDDPREWLAQTSTTLRSCFIETEVATKKHMMTIHTFVQQLQHAKSLLRLCASICGPQSGVNEAYDQCIKAEGFARELNIAFQRRAYDLWGSLTLPD